MTFYTVSKSNSEMRTNLDARLIQDFMDVIILRLVRGNHHTSGYELVKYFHHEFHMLVSSGTVYSMLYSMERQGFIEGNSDGKKRVYKLTKHGEEFLNQICMSGQRNYALFRSIFSDV
jgi:DNA-binding PadR family transcriptional regulator